MAADGDGWGIGFVVLGDIGVECFPDLSPYNEC